jgi:hypothetical protein
LPPHAAKARPKAAATKHARRRVVTTGTAFGCTARATPRSGGTSAIDRIALCHNVLGGGRSVRIGVCDPAAAAPVSACARPWEPRRARMGAQPGCCGLASSARIFGGGRRVRLGIHGVWLAKPDSFRVCGLPCDGALT